MSEDLLRHPVQLGDVNGLVQIDETVIAHPKRTRTHAARPTAEQWAFGLVDETGECHLHLVPDRAPATLIPVVQAHVVAGNTVSYSCSISVNKNVAVKKLTFDI